MQQQQITIAAKSDIVAQKSYTLIQQRYMSGKSTLMNILGALNTPTSGHYFLNGNDVSQLNDDELTLIRNREIGFVFQTFNLLFRSTALENVMLPLIYSGMPKEERINKATTALIKVQLADRMLHKPSELSGGQRQRVAIAWALVNNPSLLLADEPTRNLDTAISIEIMGLFEELYQQGNTIIVITHEKTSPTMPIASSGLLTEKFKATKLNNDL